MQQNLQRKESGIPFGYTDSETRSRMSSQVMDKIKKKKLHRFVVPRFIPEKVETISRVILPTIFIISTISMFISGSIN